MEDFRRMENVQLGHGTLRKEINIFPAGDMAEEPGKLGKPRDPEIQLRFMGSHWERQDCEAKQLHL